MPRFLRQLRPVILFLAIALTLGAVEEQGRKRVALVIDDGPIVAQNAPLLALLAREQVRVTFSHVGQNVAAQPELTKGAAAAGHEIINHSYTHPHFMEFTSEAITKEVRETQEVIRRATGEAPRWFWTPNGEWDGRIEKAVRAGGLEHFPASRFNFIDTKDWDAAITAEQFYERATTGVTDGTIILMREWPKMTLARLPAVITELKRQGAVFVTFSELLPK
jgi:peptidoglycan/xylan/chitin deacetylase (PgdA/CDA1 family)